MATRFALVDLQARGEVPDAFTQGPLCLTTIDDAALSAWKQERPAWQFSWEEIAWHFRPNPRRFEVAMWLGKSLCALATGTASKGRENVTVHYVERKLSDDRAKGWVAPVVTDAAEHFARALGCRIVNLKNVLPGAAPAYQALDFTLAGQHLGSTYYARSLDP